MYEAAVKQRRLYETLYMILASVAAAAAGEAETNTRHQTVITTTNHVCYNKTAATAEK